MQLVTIGNWVVSHGGEYIYFGGDVLCTSNGTVYPKATIVECENCPADIGTVGYEYHAGEFIPCAPFGKGKGNIAVLCDEGCKAIKDSGISISDIRKIYNTSYQGVGSTSCSVSCGFRPKLIIVTGYCSYYPNTYLLVMNCETLTTYDTLEYGFGHTIRNDGQSMGMVKCTPNDIGATWEAVGSTTNSKLAAMNESASGMTYSYSVTVIG